jgi:hypothetical protein
MKSGDLVILFSSSKKLVDYVTILLKI